MTAHPDDDHAIESRIGLPVAAAVEPMTLGQMRVHGVRSISAECTACRHEARILVDMVPDRMPVTDVAVEHEALRACLSGAVCLMPI